MKPKRLKSCIVELRHNNLKGNEPNVLRTYNKSNARIGQVFQSVGNGLLFFKAPSETYADVCGSHDAEWFWRETHKYSQSCPSRRPYLYRQVPKQSRVTHLAKNRCFEFIPGETDNLPLSARWVNIQNKARNDG